MSLSGTVPLASPSLAVFAMQFRIVYDNSMPDVLCMSVQLQEFHGEIRITSRWHHIYDMDSYLLISHLTQGLERLLCILLGLLY